MPHDATSRRNGVVIPRRRACLARNLGFLLLAHAALVADNEWRALWVDAFHPGFKSPAEVSQLVAQARQGNFNTIIVEVRKRGDAYYNSLYEPRAVDISPPSYDPLADLITKAHNTSTGPRLGVHAWIVTYNIWNNETTLPPQADHPYRLHPDWLTRKDTGETFDGYNYAFDPGHPDVQRHTFNVAMDIISRYAVDGFHFDYIRYAGRSWGYNPTTLDRFRRRYPEVPLPAPTDPRWLQFRRDQVTALVRKVYLSAIALKPDVVVSAATITWTPSAVTEAQWLASRAYSDVLQDWRGWMEEGILDLNVPMMYFRQQANAADWAAWSRFAKDHRYNRHLAIGAGLYLNTLSNSLVQLRSTREPTPLGNVADGLSGYSYAVPGVSGVTRAEFLAALTQPNAYESYPVPMFPTPTNPPVMNWKTAPTFGHLKGEVEDGATDEALDGAVIEIFGPAERLAEADGTGFYGAVDVPPGDYTLVATMPGYEPGIAYVTVPAGMPTTVDFKLSEPPGADVFENLVVSAGLNAAALAWNTAPNLICRVAYGRSMIALDSATVLEETPSRNHDALLAGLTANTRYFFRLEAWSGTNAYRSSIDSFQTAGDLILDNPDASFAGSWATGTSSTDKYGPDYRYAGTSTTAATASADWTPLIQTPGRYNVFVWYPQGSNRSAAAPFEVHDASGTHTVSVNQTLNGGGWRLIGANRFLALGSGGYVRLSNLTGESGRVVIADAVRWQYRSEQDTGATGEVPPWWALHYFGAQVSGAADPDGDGYSNWAEYLLGTVPTNAGSRLWFWIESADEGDAKLIFSPFADGRGYQLERRSSLGNDDWVAVMHAPPSVDAHGYGTIVDTSIPAGQQFYRLQIVLLP